MQKSMTVMAVSYRDWFGDAVKLAEPKTEQCEHPVYVEYDDKQGSDRIFPLEVPKAPKPRKGKTSELMYVVRYRLTPTGPFTVVRSRTAQGPLSMAIQLGKKRQYACFLPKDWRGQKVDRKVLYTVTKKGLFRKYVEKGPSWSLKDKRRKADA